MAFQDIFLRHRFLCMDVFLRHLVVIAKSLIEIDGNPTTFWGNGCIMPFHVIATALEIFGGWYYESFCLAGFWAILMSKFHDLVSIWYKLYTLMIVEISAPFRWCFWGPFPHVSGTTNRQSLTKFQADPCRKVEELTKMTWDLTWDIYT